jgi:acyl carrier protein
MTSRADIQSRVIDVITQVTLADKSTVTGRSSLFDDLGVESIDFIDIIYNLETEFGVEISNDSLFTDREFFSPEAGNWKDGRLTEQGATALKAFSYVNPDRAYGPEAQQYLYSIEMLVDYIEDRLRSA